MAREDKRRPSPRPGGRPSARRPSRSRATPAGRQRAERTGSGRTGPRFTGRAAVVLLVALVLVISYASSLRAWLDQRDELRTARAENAAAERSIESLEQDKRRWADDEYVKQQARQRFNWVEPGEVGYRVVGEDGKVLGDDVKPPVRPTGDPVGPEWYATLWGSVREAGEPPRRQTVPSDVLKPEPGDLAPKDDEDDDGRG